jgi:hypothetical protein
LQLFALYVQFSCLQLVLRGCLFKSAQILPFKLPSDISGCLCCAGFHALAAEGKAVSLFRLATLYSLFAFLAYASVDDVWTSPAG